MILNKHTNLFLGVALFSVIATVTGYSVDNYLSFTENQKQLAERSVKSTAREIELFINEQNRFVQLFAERERSLLSYLVQNPDDKAAHKELKNKVDIYFPKRFAFTITNPKGTPILKQEQELIGKACRQDILNFIADPDHYQSYVHPSPKTERRHFDVMAYFDDGRNKPSVFFVSFFLGDIFRLLENGKINQHHLFLIKNNKPGTIEATTPSAIDRLEKSGYEFSLAASIKPGEKNRSWDRSLNKQIMSSTSIPNTEWELLDVPDPDLLKKHKSNLIIQGLIALGIFSLISAIGFWLSRKLGIVSGDAQTLINSVENERQRMAMDLHDTVLSDISHIRRECRQIYATEKFDPPIKEHSKTFDDELGKITNSIREIIDDLHPQSLNLLGLSETIQAYSDRHKNQEPELHISFLTHTWDEKNISQIERMNLYRIFQEIMHNIIKHAKATLCQIELNMTSNKLFLTIKDNGIRFSVRKNKSLNGRGIKNIRARARTIHAKINWSQKNKETGTVFILEMSLANKQN